MNKKGEGNQIGIIVMIAITIIIGAIFLQVIGQSVGESVNTVEIANQSLATVANGTTQYLDFRALSSVVVYNATSDTLMDASNYTITNNVIHPTTGALSVSILPHYASAAYVSAWEVSGTAQPTTYIADGGGRAMANLIVIMFALAVLVAIIGPSVSREFLASLGK